MTATTPPATGTLQLGQRVHDPDRVMTGPVAGCNGVLYAAPYPLAGAPASCRCGKVSGTPEPTTGGGGRYDLNTFASFETMPKIIDRVRNIVTVPGRHFTLVDYYVPNSSNPGDPRPNVHTGLKLNGAGFGSPVEVREPSERNCGWWSIGVQLTPGIRGIGISTEHATQAEAAAARTRANEAPRFAGRSGEYMLVQIDGGNEPGGSGRQDRIRVERHNEHGVTEVSILTAEEPAVDDVHDREAAILMAAADVLGRGEDHDGAVILLRALATHTRETWRSLTLPACPACGAAPAGYPSGHYAGDHCRTCGAAPQATAR